LRDDAEVDDAGSVKRIVFCSGKVFYDLQEARKKSGADRVALIRLEQFYPFPQNRLREIVANFPNATEVVWCQEEPRNMGGWTFVEPRLEGLLANETRPRYVGRAASASPATGSYAIYLLEQERLLNEALAVGM